MKEHDLLHPKCMIFLLYPNSTFLINIKIQVILNLWDCCNESHQKDRKTEMSKEKHDLSSIKRPISMPEVLQPAPNCHDNGRLPETCRLTSWDNITWLQF